MTGPDGSKAGGSTAAGSEPAADGGSDSAGTVTWRELLADATSALQVAAAQPHRSAADHSGGEPSDVAAAADPTLDAARIVAEAAGVTDAELFMVLDELATTRGVAHLDAMVRRRSGGEPLQYVLGHWPFRYLDLMVDRRVLIPRPETEQVVEAALRELDRMGGKDRPTTVVDLGTGSGAIALAIATERVRTAVWATDLSADALDVARANLAGTGRAGARVRMEQGAWFDALPDTLARSVDLIVSNPPYVASTANLSATVTDWEPASALFAGTDGLDDLRTLIAGAPRWLGDHGVLVCELSPEQGPTVLDLALVHFGEAELAPDLTGRDRALVARHPRR
ncbi:MAG TPA: peptide chain release factor N(5)-glutamine methyltransferase [Microthrixaceae bacterium]|jgi:release factor glutamine methyltransferase|nr:peptide chain release factor N(5)-glutamine methyltransferase [Microthrixaceae bacterium]